MDDPEGLRIRTSILFFVCLYKLGASKCDEHCVLRDNFYGINLPHNLPVMGQVNTFQECRLSVNIY